MLGLSQDVVWRVRRRCAQQHDTRWDRPPCGGTGVEKGTNMPKHDSGETVISANTSCGDLVV